MRRFVQKPWTVLGLPLVSPPWYSEGMSLAHWKATTVARNDLIPAFQPIIELARQYDKVITFLDLEATTFLGRPNFGITEIGMLHVNTRGQIGTSGSFVNPERSISREVQELTGITPAMVRDAKTWGEGWAQALKYIAANHIVIGYNTQTFDVPAIKSQNKRYDPAELEFPAHWDAMKIYRKAFNTNKGKLVEAAAALGIDVSRFKGHRATEDTILTAHVFLALWQQFPQWRPSLREGKAVYAGAVPSRPTPAVASTSGTPKQDKSPDTVVKKAPRTALINREHLTATITEYYQSKCTFGMNDLDVLAGRVEHNHPSPDGLRQSISFEISRLLDIGQVGVLEPEDAARRTLLEQNRWHEPLLEIWTGKQRLAPVLDLVKTELPDINYIDLRWMLHHHGVRTMATMHPTSVDYSQGPN